MTTLSSGPSPRPFTYEAPATRIVFGAGKVAALPDEVARAGGCRALVIAAGSSARLAASTLNAMSDRVALHWDAVAQHVPVELAARARDAVARISADILVAIGGGSAIGLAKAVALTHHVPVIAVPSTYSGSEMTDIYGLTGGTDKQTGRNPDVRPRTVIYDPALTLGLPSRVTGTSAFNALAHAVEAVYAPNANPVTDALAVDAIRRITRGLPLVIEHPEDIGRRADLLAGAHLAAAALATTTMGLHHKLCHVLGGSLDLVHADVHTVLLPYVLAHNAPRAETAIHTLALALDAEPADAAGALWDLATTCGLPVSLAEFGVTSNDINAIVPKRTHIDGPNSGPIASPAVASILTAALAGTRPTATPPPTYH